MSRRRRNRQVLLCILIVAFAVRAIHFLALKEARFDQLPTEFTNSDMHANLQWAGGITAGDWLGVKPYHPYNDWMKEIAPLEKWHSWWGGEQVFQQAPLYPYLLAAVFSVFGERVDLVLALQLLLGVLQCGLIYGIANRLFGVGVARGAAALAALYAPFIFFQGVLLRDTLLTTLELTSFYGFLQLRRSRSTRHAVLAGAAAGLAVLCKPTALLLPFGYALWLLLERRERLEFRAALAIIVVGAACVSLLPLIARNLVLGLSPLSISNRAAEALIIANAKGGHTMVLQIPESLGEIMEKTGGRPLAVLRETIATWNGDWAGFVRFQLGKLQALLSPLEIENNANYYYGYDISPLLPLMARFSFIFPFFVLGLFRRRGRGAAQGLLLFLMLLLLPGLLMSTPLARYRLTFVCLAIIVSVLGARAFIRAMRAHEFTRLTLMVGVLAGLVVVHQTYLSPDSDPRVLAQLHRPQEYLFASAAFEKEEDYERAIRMLDLIEQRAHDRPDFDRLRRFVRARRGELYLAWALEAATKGLGPVVKIRLQEAEENLAAAGDTGSSLFRVGAMLVALGEKEHGRELIEAHLQAHPDTPHQAQAQSIIEKYFAAGEQADQPAAEPEPSGEAGVSR